MAIAYLNGRSQPRGKACVSVLDLGFISIRSAPRYALENILAAVRVGGPGGYRGRPASARVDRVYLQAKTYEAG